MAIKSRCSHCPRRSLQTLLLILVVVASPVANAVAPVLTEDDLRYLNLLDRDGTVEIGWKLSASTTITKHQYRFTAWNREVIPAPGAWTDLPLTSTRCSTVSNPGTPSASSTPATTGAACATTGSDATNVYRYWTTVEGLTNGLRYRFELRAVNSDGNSDTVYDDLAFPADPSGIVTIPDAQLETRVRTRIGSALNAADPITQLHMARIPYFYWHSETRTPANRIRSLDGIEHAVNAESLFVSHHSILATPQLAGMYQLKFFHYQGSLLSDMTPFQNLVNLEQLYLNRGRTFPPEGVCSGTADGLEFGSSSAWPPSASCPTGQVDDVVVRDIRPLRRLTKLKRLFLCDQRVNPAQLTPFVNVEILSFCRNDASDISGMSSLASSTHIYAFENRIEDVSPLAGLSELQLLHLHDNAVRDVSSLSGLTKLRQIYLSDNPLDAGVCADSVGVLLSQHTTRAACEGASGNWTTKVVSTLSPLVTGQCSDDSYNTEAGCLGASGTWTAGTLKLIDLRGDTSLTDADIAALSGLSGATVLHDADIRPAVPQGLSFSTSTRAATLTWTDPSDADIAAYQYRHRQGDGAWSDWTLSTKEGSSFHHWARGPANLTSLELSDLPGGEHEVELRALVASDYNAARNTNSDGSSFSAIKSHQTAVQAAAAGAGRWDVGRVLTPGLATSTMVGVPVTASIASTAPAALTETNLDGATVTVELSGTTFGASMATTSFPLMTSPTIAGLKVASVSRTSDTEARLTLRFDDTDFTLRSTLSVQVLAAALASGGDLDTQTVTVAPTVRLLVSNAVVSLQEDPGGSNANSGAYNLSLTGQPAASVFVRSNSTNADLSLVVGGGFPLTFTDTTWNQVQTMAVRTDHDDDAVDDVAYIQNVVTAAGDGDPATAGVDVQATIYQNGTPESLAGCTMLRASYYLCPRGPRVLVTVNDDDTPGLTVPMSLNVTEGGALSSYSVVLDTQPTGPVTVALSSSDGAVSLDADINIDGNQDSLLFSTTNWNTAKTVYVTGVQDDDGEDETVTLTHDPSGGDYGDVANAEVPVSVTDNDTQGATGTPLGLIVQENSAATYTLVLHTEPAGGDVSVAVASSDSSTIAVSPVALTFTAGNWNMPQRVTVEGLDDADAGDEVVTLSHTPTGADYGTVTIGDVTVSVLDDDAAGVEVSPVELTVGESSTATYTVRLNAAPSATTTVTMATSTGSGLTLDTDAVASGNQNTLSFTATDWDTAQTVTVTGVADDDGEDETSTVTHTLTGGGAAYATLNPNRIPSVSVRVEDDQTAGVVVEPSSLTFDEGGEARYEVKLSAPPASGSATVSVTAAGTATLNVNVASSLSFDATNWNTAKSVLVTSTADHARVSDATATLSHGVTGYGTVDTGPEVAVRVRNTTVDYDSDADGLIEISNLAQLNAVRWDLDGDGTAATTTHAAAFPNARNGVVCPTATTGVSCTGYELMRDLDFNSDRAYANWLPIGVSSADNGVEAYTGTFSGNGRVIANLRVGDISVGASASLQPPTAAGLFGRVEGRIESLGLTGARVRGGNDVGTIAGDLRGHLVASYATGEATGLENCGGLAGSTGGSARDAARIVASYANVSVRCNGLPFGLGAARAGGLVGQHVNGPIVASYAIGRVRSARGGGGGLAGRGPRLLRVGTADDSYWDREATGQTSSYTSSDAGATTGDIGTSVATPAGGLTKAAMQSPTDYSGIYADWNVDLDGDFVADDPWDFGTSSQYPSLKWRGFDPRTQTGTQPRPPSVTDPGDGDGSANQAPEIARALADATLEEDGTLSVDLSTAFRDPDSNELAYSARSSNPGVASVSVQDDVLVVSARSFGVATVTVTATDGNLSTSQSFLVRVGLLVEFAGDASAPEGGTIRLRLVSSEPAPRRLVVAYAVAPGSDPSTAADASDHAGGTGGEAVFAEGAERTEIQIDVLDDDAVEPVREHFALTLLPPEEDAGYGVGERAGAVAIIEEGVCDRSEVLRDALRGERSCEAVADLSSRTSLRLSETGLLALRIVDLLGLSRLQLLDLSRNGLSAWPEGVLAALPSLHTLRLGGNRIGSLPESLAHPRLSALVLSNNALAALPAGAFSGLSELRQLLLDGNALEELPAGLFEGVGQLRELHLQDNPGAPFALTVDLVRTDAQAWTPGPASVAARVAAGAPFALEAALEASAGELPEGATVSIPAGAAQGAPATVQQSGAMPATVRLTAAPAVPETECEYGLLQRRCFQGMTTRAGEPLVLFKQPPMPLAVDDQTLEAGGDALRFDLSERFEAAAGEALKYKAESSDESVLRVSVVAGVLFVEALDEGMATVTVVATDEDGQTGTLSFVVQATERLHAGWRGWRLILLEQARATKP